MNTNQLAVLHAAIDRIIPPDDFPGAWGAGVGDFITRILQTDLQSTANDFFIGLDCLDSEANHQLQKPFAQLSESEIDTLLARVESGKVSIDWPINPRQFFRTLVDLTAEGFYSDPGNGGNRNCISWTMIGYDPGANGPA